MALRTIKSSAESKDQPVFAHFGKPSSDQIQPDHYNIDLNKVMENMGLPQFTYESFSAAYESDPQIESLVDNFNSQGIYLNSEDDGTEMQGNADDSNKVSQMAKSAVDLDD